LKVISIKALKVVKTTSNNEAINSFRVFETTVFYKKIPRVITDDRHQNVDIRAEEKLTVTSCGLDGWNE